MHLYFGKAKDFNMSTLRIIIKKEYTSFWTLKKLILMVFTFIFYKEDLVSKMADLSGEFDLPLNCFEPFILVMSYEIHAMILPIMFIVLLCDYPDTTSDNYFHITRISRRQWLVGETVSSVLVAVSFIGLFLVSTIIPTLGHGSFGGDWSPYTTDFFYSHPEIYGQNIQLFIRTSTVAQGSLSNTFFFSFFLMLLYLVLISQIILTFRLLDKKYMGYIITIFATIMGIAGVGYIEQIKWIFPVAHAVFGTHFREFFYKPEMQIQTSILYFCVMIAVFFACNFVLVKKYNFGGAYDSGK